MIIKNNYNDKSVNPLDNYESIGKGSNSQDKKWQKEKEGFIEDNMNNPILRQLRGENEEIEDIENQDKWDFFR